MKKKIFGCLFYSLAVVLVTLYIGVALQPTVTLDTTTTLVIAIISCLLIYFGGVLLSKYYKNDKPLKINLWLFFALYILLFVDLTLLDTAWGRRGLFVSFNLEYLKNSVNLIPFSTIYEYLIENFNNLTNTSIIFYNIFGNFVALMPMAFFLPLLFKKENNFKTFFLTMLIITLGVELLQLFGGVGRFDIDDVILNVGGSLLMFKILKIKEINLLIKKIFLLEKNKIDIKKLIKIFIVIGIFLIGLLILIKYRNSLYKDNLDTLHYQMEIVDESSSCTEGLDKFYENEFYNYYFTCKKSDKVYAIINEKDKYLVKDLLNNNTSKYNVDIERIEERLEFYKIKYQKESKYTNVMLNINLINHNDSYTSPEMNVNVLDKSIIEAKLDYRDADVDLEKYNITLHFIPKQKGTTTVEVSSFDSNTEELIDKREYKIVVDKDLKVNYELIDYVDMTCLENFLGGYITSEKNVVKDETLENVVSLDLTKVKSSKVKVTDNDNIYIIIDALDPNIFDILDDYFQEIYPNYQKAKYHNFTIYLSNDNSDFNLENDLKDVCK